ncbi:MAG: hypothetical protein H0Z34_11640 [Brevibacillus sp.]|nr:hypothetical protein [Brevibacillus sp.]
MRSRKPGKTAKKNKEADSLRSSLQTKCREYEWGVFRAHVRWPTSEEAVQDRSTTIRRGSGKTMLRAQPGQTAKQRCFCARPLRDGEADNPTPLMVGNGVRKGNGRLLYPDTLCLHTLSGFTPLHE